MDRFEFTAPKSENLTLAATVSAKSEEEQEIEDNSASFGTLSRDDKDLLLLSYSILAKHEKDFEALKNNLNNV